MPLTVEEFHPAETILAGPKGCHYHNYCIYCHQMYKSLYPKFQGNQTAEAQIQYGRLDPRIRYYTCYGPI